MGEQTLRNARGGTGMARFIPARAAPGPAQPAAAVLTGWMRYSSCVILVDQLVAAAAAWVRPRLVSRPTGKQIARHDSSNCAKLDGGGAEQSQNHLPVDDAIGRRDQLCTQVVLIEPRQPSYDDQRHRIRPNEGSILL